MTLPMGPGTPPDPRYQRFRPMGQFLLGETIAVAVLAAASLVLPARAAGAAGTAVVVLLIGIPVVRVLWLVGRWVRRGDLRFAAVGTAVLAVMAAGYTVALLLQG